MVLEDARQKKEEASYPIAVTPAVGEIFLSWLARVANAHGLTARALINILYKDTSFKNREIDRFATEEIVTRLADVTNVDHSRALRTSLWLYLRPISRTDILNNDPEWITHTNSIFTSHQTYGLCYCPSCLSEDVPYFKLIWRISFVVICPKHKEVLQSKCPSCSAEVNIYRLPADVKNLAICHNCGFNLRRSRSKVDKSFLEFLPKQMFLLDLLALAPKCDEFGTDIVKGCFNILRNYVYLCSRHYHATLKTRYWRLFQRLNITVEYEDYPSFNSFSPLHRFIILDIALKECGKGPCNYMWYSFNQHHIEKVCRRLKKLPCGPWCERHDYYNMCHSCSQRLLKTFS